MSIYPEVTITEKDQEIIFETILRKEHNGKWYLGKITSNYYGQIGTSEALSEFHKEVYTSIILGQVSEDIVYSNGDPVFKEDEDQISEKDRLLRNMML